MAASFLRLLALLALVMMPFGMVAMPASASVSHHSAMTDMPAGHCDESMPQDDDGAMQRGMNCAMACSVVTPTAMAAPAPVALIAARPDLPILATFVGRQPESDPPPPKLA